MSGQLEYWHTSSRSEAQTERLGELVGHNLKGGEIIELVSDLGGGKTAFTRGLARGMGSKDHVASPTFTIAREYHSGKRTLYHFDFYRLQEPGIMTDELAEVIRDPNAVIAVEWSDIVQHVLPKKRLTLALTLTGDTERDLKFSYPPELDYLIPKELA